MAGDVLLLLWPSAGCHVVSSLLDWAFSPEAVAAGRLGPSPTCLSAGQKSLPWLPGKPRKLGSYVQGVRYIKSQACGGCF